MARDRTTCPLRPGRTEDRQRARIARSRVVFGFTIRDGRIVATELIADPERIAGMDLAILET
jgi:hypothetical protein